MASILMRFMIDTDIAIYTVQQHPAVMRRMLAVDPWDLAMSALVHSQLMQGLAREELRPQAREDIDRLAGTIAIVPYDTAASDSYGRIIEALGFSRPQTFDRMIAAHAISIGATLVTNNLADFAGIEGLRLENWADA